MGMFKLAIHDALRLRRIAGIFDHFDSYTDTQMWTKGGVGGTVTNSDGDGGILTMATGASQNNTSFVYATRKNQTFVANKCMEFQCGLSYTENDTNKAAIFVGFTSNTVPLSNTTGLPISSFSGCGIFKAVGDTKWSAITSVGTTQQISQSKTLTQNAGIPQEPIVQVMLNNNNQVEATFWMGSPGPGTITGGGATGQTPMINNVTGMSGLQPIKHFVAFSGAAAMTFGVFVLAGSAAGETLSLDYVGKEFLSIL